jgi:flavorubredoxin
MNTQIDEIAERIYRFSTFVPEIAAPAGFTFNQYLIDADEPLLFHCGPRTMFPLVSAAFATIMPIERLRWIAFGHVEADECGSMNLWLAAAPKAQVVHGHTACLVSLNDLADRLPRALANGEVLDIGGRRVRYIDTPHVPHAWESGLIYEETTSTLFCGDLFTQVGQGPSITQDSLIEAAIAAESAFHFSSLTPATGPTIRMLAALKPKRLAVMHGSCYAGDCTAALSELAAYYDTAHAAGMETKKTTAEELGEGVARLREKALVHLEDRGYHMRGKTLGDIGRLLVRSAAAVKSEKPKD